MGRGAHSVEQDGRPASITGGVINGSTTEESAALVAACTAAAAHRRDHHHAAPVTCHPHVVEVVHLGHRAVTVCHDCESDCGFMPEREAEAVAHAHRIQTSGDAGARLGPAA
jgi:hypothetical protein